MDNDERTELDKFNDGETTVDINIVAQLIKGKLVQVVKGRKLSKGLIGRVERVSLKELQFSYDNITLSCKVGLRTSNSDQLLWTSIWNVKVINEQEDQSLLLPKMQDGEFKTEDEANALLASLSFDKPYKIENGKYAGKDGLLKWAKAKQQYDGFWKPIVGIDDASGLRMFCGADQIDEI